jgi:AraC-like DNA-binding protein
MKSVLYFWNGLALFLGELTDASEHRHNAIQLSIGLTQSFKLQTSDREKAYQAVITAPNSPHRFIGYGGKQAILLIEPETRLGQSILQKYLQNHSISEIAYDDFKMSLNELRNHLPAENKCKEAKLLCNSVLNTLLEAPVLPKPIDPRIEKALSLIERSQHQKISSKTIAQQIYLSESRFIHLFSEQMGIPLRRYLLWLRLIQGIKVALEGVSLTSAAHEVGFADSAHFSRTFKEMFGLTPSELFKNSKFVQAISCID